MTEWYLGTMGFSYKDWVGPFYPADLPSREFLTYYSRIFHAAEIDSTFYGAPKPESVQRWSSQTPEGYRFCIKAPRLITHELGLVGAESLMAEFVQTVRLLGDKLGVILLQFPGSFPSDEFPVFRGFLSTLPPGARYAVELRHPSWHKQAERTADLLTEQGVDLRAQLQDWWERLQAHLPEVEAVYGFFNNDYAGFAPVTANRFKEIAGLPVEGFQPPGQLPLF
jgi:uncharacterized protein YecE (DUF72 family)